jgi:2-C-methyl-D-erythritol 4-phosphate cytidylyltransferase
LALRALMLTAIIVAAGSRRRIGFDKTLASIHGRPIFAHSIAAFEAAACVTELVVVAREERLPELREMIHAQGFGKISAVVAGGARRQDSVRNGLQQIGPSATYVAVHDAARPLVRPDLIERAFAAAQEHGAAACAAPVNDTLKRVDQTGGVIAGVDRDHLFAVQTPQIFRHELLVRAYAAVFASHVEITDEISAAEQIEEKTFLVPNDEPNFKLTYPSDLALAEFILRGEELKS